MSTAIVVENVSKQYRLGKIGTGTISHDLNRWWHTIRGKENPYLKIGETNDRSTKGSSEYVWALQDINFQIEQGEAVGIIGRNGAGKSTLLKILSRTTAPTTGQLKLRGRAASLLEVGTGFHPELSGRENIYLNGAILGMTRKEIAKKFDEIVEFSGVERYIDTPVKRYSSGMYVRLAFAVAAHLESEILIVDEVLAVGDIEFQKKCLGKMSEVSNGEGRTVLFVSHNMAAIDALCSKAIVLKNGAKIFDGNQVEGIRQYLSSEPLIQHQSAQYFSEEDAPGDDRAKVISVKAEPQIGEIINFDSGINLIFTIKSNIKHALLDVSFNLKTRDQTLVMSHGYFVSPLNELQRGLYTVCAKIPPYLLNEGTYSIDVWLGLGTVEQVGKGCNNVISFDVARSNMDHILKTLPGIIRPRIDYEINYSSVS